MRAGATFPLEDIASAYEAAESGSVMGGVGLKIDGCGQMRSVYSAAWLSSATTPRSRSPM